MERFRASKIHGLTSFASQYWATLTANMAYQPVPPPEPGSLASPTEFPLFCSFPAARDALNEFTRTQGYAVTIRRTNLNKDNEPVRYYMHCDRSGMPSLEGNQQHERTSRWQNCPFDIVFSQSLIFGGWLLHI